MNSGAHALAAVVAAGTCAVVRAEPANTIDAWFDERGRPSPLVDEVLAAHGLPRVIAGAPLVYTREAAARGEAGCITVRFMIRPDGLIDDFAVLDSQPPGVFDHSVLRWLHAWRFEPIPERREVWLPIRLGFAAPTGSHVKRVPRSCARPRAELTGLNLPGATPGPMPFFPPALVSARTSGCVTLVFRVQPDGRADDYGVVDAVPAEAFVPAAVSALNDWRFEGIGAGRQGVARFAFTLGWPELDASSASCKWPAVTNAIESPS